MVAWTAIMVAEMARSVREDRLTEAQGGREIGRFLALEFPGRAHPPTAIPVRWTNASYKPLTRLRLWVAQRLRGTVGH